MDNQGKRLDAEWAEMYAAGCPVCGKQPCECVSYSITKGQEEAIRGISDQLRSLIANGVTDSIVKEALLTAEKAEATPTPQLKRNLFDKAKRVFTGIKDYNETTEAVGNVSEHFEGALDALESWL